MVESNPFTDHKPIRDPERFFGRKRQLAYMFDLIRRQQNVSIVGQRRMGKTSLLYNIMHPDVIRRAGLDPAQCRCVYVDGQMLGSYNDEWLYGAIASELGEPVDAIPFEGLVGRLKSVTSNDSQLIVALDEFELLAANPLYDASAFNRLRGLAEHFSRPIQFVTASKEPLERIAFANGDARSSPFFNNFATTRISLFEREEGVELLETLSARGGQPFDNGTIELIINWVGLHPLFLQIAGYRLFAAQSSGSLNDASIAEARAQVTDDIEPHLTYYWKALTAEDQYFLAALTFQEFETANPAWQRLETAGVVAGGDYIGDLFRDFVRRQHVDGLLQVNPFVMDIRHRAVRINTSPVHLTATEFDALQLLMKSDGNLVTSEDIEAELWPGEIALDPERARGIMKKVRRKLGDAGESLVTVRGKGYFLRGK